MIRIIDTKEIRKIIIGETIYLSFNIAELEKRLRYQRTNYWKITTARKHYKCIYCKKDILKGDQYMKFWKRGMQQLWVCCDCFEVKKNLLLSKRLLKLTKPWHMLEEHWNEIDIEISLYSKEEKEFILVSLYSESLNDLFSNILHEYISGKYLKDKNTIEDIFETSIVNFWEKEMQNTKIPMVHLCEINYIQTQFLLKFNFEIIYNNK